MDTGGLAQTAQHGFAASNGLGMPTTGLASRRGGQNIKPLSFDSLKSPADRDNGAPTPRTSRSHLLAGLRTAPKSATGATFPNNPVSPTTALPPQMRARNSAAAGMYNDNLYSGPKTSLPRYGASHSGYNQSMGYGQQFTAEQILAPPEIQLDDQSVEQMDPGLYAQLAATNAYLAQQKQRLQQQLMNIQAAAQQFQGLSVANAQPLQQAYQNLYQQQQQAQQMMATNAVQPNIFAVYDPVTGQQTFYMDQSNQLLEQPHQQQQFGAAYGYLPQAQNAVSAAPRLQVSPPPADALQTAYRNSSPPRRFESPDPPTPLPPPSANAFRRGHKKSSSLAVACNAVGPDGALEPPKSAGPKTANFPLTPLTATGTYGPGQARAGEHPVRQPRGPPSFDELSSKPTAKHEGSKNFVTRTRRSAVHNLVRAGLERRKGTGSSLGSISPIDESAEEAETPLTDNDSDSGRSGSGSLGGEEAGECSLPSSRTSTGSWGAIGSDRPRSRQKTRGSIDSDAASDSERDCSVSGANSNSFASVFKNGAAKAKAAEGGETQRKAPMLVLTSAEKRKGGAVLVA